MEQPDTDEPKMFNSDGEFEDIQTELVSLQEEMEYDGIVVDDLEPDDDKSPIFFTASIYTRASRTDHLAPSASAS